MAVKLTQKKADSIRAFAKKSKWSQSRIAAKYGVSRSCVHDVLSGRTWNRY